MNLLDHFVRLFTYDAWANQETLRSLRSASPPPVHAVGRFAHIISAERVWLERLRRHKQPFPVWPNFSLEQCEHEASAAARLWSEYLSTIAESDLGQSVSYTNTAGQSWTSRVEDVLMHVVMHSAYHRGQIAADLRATRQAPSNTDFIHAVRQRVLG